MASAPTPDDIALARAAAAAPLDTAVAADPALPRRLAAADWSAGVVEEGGQFHRVLVLPGVGVVRMTRTPATARALPDRMAAVRHLGTTAALPFSVPVPLTEVVPAGSEAERGTEQASEQRSEQGSELGSEGAREPSGPREGVAGVVQAYLPGEAHPPHSGDPAVLRGLCETLARIDTVALRPHLGAPFAFRGPWTPAKVAAVRDLPGLLADTYGSGAWSGTGATAAAAWDGTVELLTGTVTAWTEHPVVEPSLVHGDLAGHNMRWQREGGAWRLTGILDWDLATVWDPALNPAYLALWHGEEKLEDIARDAAEARRARVWLGAMALESLYDASLREGPGRRDTGRPPNWPKLLRKVLPRIERAVAALGPSTLHDPARCPGQLEVER